MTKQEVMKAVKGSAGIVSTVAKRLDCDWHTAKKHINKHAETKLAMQAEKEINIDVAEMHIVKALREGDLQIVKWYLSTIGKDRGYTEKNVGEHPEQMVEDFRMIMEAFLRGDEK